MSDWRDIKNAPLTGEWALLWNGHWSVGFWNGTSWDDGDFHDKINRVTHWMPLPEPPK